MAKLVLAGLSLFLAPLSWSEDLPYSWKGCENSWGRTSPFDEEGRFHPECMPDTLYTWQPWRRVKWMVDQSSPSEILPLSEYKGYIYGWRTPLGTSYYNNSQASVRMKLRPGLDVIHVHSRGERDCKLYPKAMKGEAIIVLDWPYSHEYIICNSKAVESWSTGTPEHVAELERELKQVKNKGHEAHDRFYYKKNRICYMNNLREQGTLDLALRNVKGILDYYKGEGKVFTQPDLELTREDHFKSKDKSYFNPGGKK